MAYSLWIAFLKENHIMHANEYENNLQEVAEIADLAAFWQIYQHIKRPSALPVNCELFFFRSGIKPVWENKHNRGGGKFIVRATRDQCDGIWEKMLVETLMWSHQALCGIVLNVKKREMVVSIWTRELEHHSDKEEIRKWIREILGIGDGVYIEYKEHPFTEDIAPLEKDWDNLLQIAKSGTMQNL